MRLREFYVNIAERVPWKLRDIVFTPTGTNYKLQDYLLPSNEGLPFKGKDRVI